MTKVAIVGFGYIGTCLGAVLGERGHHVVGIDPRADVVKEINAGTTSVREPGLQEIIQRVVSDGRLQATSDFSAAHDADVILVTVGTPLDEDHAPDMSQIASAATQLAHVVRPGHLVILKSTLPPRTTENFVRPILERAGLRAGQDFLLAYCPERIAEGRAIRESQSITIVVGGVNDASTQAACDFWRSALGVDVFPVATPRAAELTKLADNLFIDLSIAVANELALLCDKLDIDVLEVVSAANTLPKGEHNVNILIPSMGVGGSCLVKDPWFVHAFAKAEGIDLRTPVTSRGVNDRMPRYTFELIERILQAAGKRLSDCTVAALGIAFKSDTGDCRFTPTRETIRLLEGSGCDLRVCDPWVNEADALTVTSRPLVAEISDAVRGADCVAFFTGHIQFKEFPLAELARLVKPGCLVLDGRMFFTREQIAQIRSHGLTYKGIGR